MPKYSNEEGDGKKWWTNQIDYNSNVAIISSKELNHNKKMCGSGKPMEPIMISDHMDQEPTKDAFKVLYVAKPPKPTGQDPCTEKVTRVRHVACTDEAEHEAPNTIAEKLAQFESAKYMSHKWSKMERQFVRGEKKVRRFFDSLPGAAPAASDLNEVPSSFNPLGIHKQNQIINSEYYDTKKKEEI